MGCEIQSLLSSTISNGVKVINLKNANDYWQQKIARSTIDLNDSLCIVFPETIVDYAKIVKLSQEQKWRILCCGSGSKLDWGQLGKNIQLIISTIKCNRIIEYAVGDLTITVESGIKLIELQQELAKFNQFIPLDPAYSELATIGGIVATGDTGSFRERYGGVRDLILGISIIRADGKIVKAGGRVVKNVAGYDLMKLMSGSYGTLGIISEITFRTYPIQKTSQTVILTGDRNNIIKVIKSLKNSSLTPTCMDLVSSSVMKELDIGDRMGVLIRFQTIPESIEKQVEKLEIVAESKDLTVINYPREKDDRLWSDLSSIIRTADSSNSIICKLGILPSFAVDLLSELSQLSCFSRVHLGSGIGEIKLNSQDVADIEKIRNFCQKNNGFLTVLTAPKSIKKAIDVWGYTGNSLFMMKQIKQKFDPQNILNPDRFIGDI